MSSAARERLEALGEELDRIAEELADVAMGVLREALDSSDEGVAHARGVERLLNRARASVEKAVHLTRRAAADGEEAADLG